MAEVNGEPDFTQFDKVNITDEFLIKGSPVTPDAEEIIEATIPYTLLGTENIISLSGSGSITMLASASATHSVIVFAATGTITLILQGGDTTNQSTITVGNSASYAPITGQWIAV